MARGEPMKIAGIIAEYNPFHTGHAWHIAQTRLLTGCDYVVVCMDGHFTQRGELALFSKWARVRMALSCGADAVFELPTLFALRTADVFARAGVTILGRLGCDALSFGCEITDLNLIRTLSRIREHEPPEISADIQNRLKSGQSHARARGEATAANLGIAPKLLGQPNLILGVEYIRWIDALGLPMMPVAVPRQGRYHDAEMGEFASASAIRGAFLRGESPLALRYIPRDAQPWAIPEDLHPLDDLLLYRLRNMPLTALRALPDISEGLEHRLCRLCRENSTCEALLDALKCKRYTHARLSRLLAHALLGTTQSALDAHPTPTFARLLGMRANAGPLLRELHARASLPIAASPYVIAEDEVFQFECRAADIWALAHNRPESRLPGREFTEKFVRL